jgi:hypothetical protein
MTTGVPADGSGVSVGAVVAVADAAEPAADGVDQGMVAI